MTTPRMQVAPEAKQGCVSLIGMAGCGKSTIGKYLARYLGWVHLDTDHLIEASYGVPLQTLTDTLSRDEFLHTENEVILSVRLQRTIISTGGSAVYSSEAMQHLSTLGPIVHIDVPLEEILARLARKPERGLVIAPGQTIEDLFAERVALYEQWRTQTFFTPGTEPVEDVARALAAALGLPPEAPTPPLVVTEPVNSTSV